MEHVGQYYMFDRELYVIAVDGPDDLPQTFDLKSPYFACLLVGDARGVVDEVLRAVARCLTRAGCVYSCCWGPDCERVHDIFDIVNLELRPDGPWAMSTWHSREPLSEAIWFLLTCADPDPAYFNECKSAIGITIGSSLWAAEVKAALSSPEEFSTRVLAE